MEACKAERHVVKFVASAEVKMGDQEVPAIILGPFVTLFRDAPHPSMAALKSGNLGQLVDAIRGEHNQGFIDRDVRPANVGLDKTGALCKFDLSFATNVGEKAVWSGTLRHASDSVLRHMSTDSRVEYEATKQDDLHSVVRTAFHLLHPHLMYELQSISTTDSAAVAHQIIEFWDDKLRADVWARAVAAAEKCDYDHLKAILNSLL